MVSASAFAASESPTQPVAVRVPDLSHYDCSTVAAAPSKNTLHIGQVINNRYYEWNEIYAVNGAQQTLLCISLTVPQAQQLSATEAKAFLVRSAAVGVPAPGASSNAEHQSDMSEPTDVQPAPRMHVRRRTLPHTPDNTPPIPAEHHASDPPAATVPAPPAIEKPQVLNDLEGANAVTTDGRQLVGTSTVTSFPYNTIGYLTVTYPDGQSFRCSGTVVSAYVVLTAGHCIHNNTHGGWVTQVRFYPAQSAAIDGSPQRPYGVNTGWTNLKATQMWTQISGPDSFDIDQYRYDYAAIQFSTPFTYTTTFMPVLYSSTGSPANNAGYPANVPSSSADQYGQFFMSGSETSDSQSVFESVNVREFALNSSGGDSGSPFWLLDSNSGRRSLTGSLSYGDDPSTDSSIFSGGPWYDSWNQSTLSSWIAWTPTTSSNSLPVTGLRVGDILTSAATSGQSYLRFYNSGSAAGTVTVTLSDASTGTPLAQWTSPSIPPGASPQFGLATIETGATPTFTKPALYSIAIQSGITGYFQHVLWHAGDGSLTNLSTCDSGPTAISQAVINVHTSVLAGGYPSTVVIFNTGTSAAAAQLGIYNATTGSRLATYTTASIPANGQLALPVTTLEANTGISPGNLYHYVIKFETQFTGFLQHLVNNSQSGVITDMTAVCALVP